MIAIADTTNLKKDNTIVLHQITFFIKLILYVVRVSRQVIILIGSIYHIIRKTKKEISNLSD